MAYSSRSTPPQRSVEDETDEVIRSLHELSLSSKGKSKLVKATVHHPPADPSLVVQSWKMDEWKYSVVPSPFPTLARGLFTRRVDENGQPIAAIASGSGSSKGKEPEAVGEENNDDASSTDVSVLGSSNGRGRHVIVARGYDKFFNIGETPWNSWESLEKYTEGPYYLTLKTNGCIIFIAALTPEKIVVTSKHSLGAHGDAEASHAVVGERWVLKHLASKGKTVEVLANRLYKDNVTAVAELCDDSFEEHILAYPPDRAGLYLHGINKNRAAFATAPPDEVEQLATEFGMFSTETVVKHSVAEVQAFTNQCAETGEWNGEAIEGFVVRCKVRTGDVDATSDAKEPDSAQMTTALRDKASKQKNGRILSPPPYPPGSDFFFKVKFEEPYLMYRGWREMTKTILSFRERDDAQKLTKPLRIAPSRLTRPESRLYRHWVEREMDRDPSVFESYGKNQGIIAVRERFLDYLKTEEGKKELEKEGPARAKSSSSTAPNGSAKSLGKQYAKGDKVVIVPVAVPGCGKTAVSVALTKLFGFAHTQSDDVKAKKTAPGFQKSIEALLETHDIVIADRNNHLVQHRQGIREATKRQSNPVHLLALHWSLNNLPLATIHRICSARVIDRGQNHQSLRPSGTTHDDVIWQFITGSQELGGPESGEVDDVIEMDLAADSLESSVRRAVDGITERMPFLAVPSDEQIKEACVFAAEYKPTVRKDLLGASKTTPVRYYAFIPEINVFSLIEGEAESSENSGEPSTQTIIALLRQLRNDKRLVQTPHITLVHRQGVELQEPGSQDLWNKCETMVSDASFPSPVYRFQLGHVVCDDRVMAITVEQVEADEEENSNPQSLAAAKTLLDELGDELRGRMHITVGTSDASIKAVEGGLLVKGWKEGRTDLSVISLKRETVLGRIRSISY